LARIDLGQGTLMLRVPAPGSSLVERLIEEYGARRAGESSPKALFLRTIRGGRKMNLGITGFEHVAVQVADLERSLAFYTATLGLTLRERSEIPQRGLRKALIAVGTGQIELLEYQDKAVPAADGPVAHLALTVTDIAVALAALKRAGVRLEDEAPRAVGGGCQIAFLRGPDGEHIELFQPARA